MEYSEFETIKHLEEQIKDLKSVVNINKKLRIIGLGSKKISDLEDKILQLEAKLKELKETPKKFNALFSERGWITHDSLNHEFMKKAIQVCEDQGIDKAEKLILEYYKPENRRNDYTRLRALPELSKRQKLIDYAIKEYKEEKYYSVVPLLLMIIDGTVHEIVGKGFHSDKSEIDVWNSITNIDNGILKIKDIFMKGRYVTRNENISFPYRNGILHGLDLGYDNYIVAAKSWHYLFVIRDWGLSKRSEEIRKEKFKKDSTPPTFKEISRIIEKNNQYKSALDSWKEREITSKYYDLLHLDKPTNENLPETIALRFLDYWKKKNYGYMAHLYWSIYNKDGKPNIIEIRNQFSDLPISDFRITKIKDDAPAISVIDVNADIDSESKEFKVRMIYESSDGSSRPRNLIDGTWKIVFVQEKK